MRCAVRMVSKEDSCIFFMSKGVLMVVKKKLCKRLGDIGQPREPDKVARRCERIIKTSNTNIQDLNEKYQGENTQFLFFLI